MNKPTFTPGPWYTKGWNDRDEGVPIFSKDNHYLAVVNYLGGIDQARINGRLIAAAPDRHEQLTALILHEWTIEKRSLYDEEGIEGWAWIEPDGTEHVDTGAWDELPPWPESARAALAKAVQP